MIEVYQKLKQLGNFTEQQLLEKGIAKISFNIDESGHALSVKMASGEIKNFLTEDSITQFLDTLLK